VGIGEKRKRGEIIMLGLDVIFGGITGLIGSVVGGIFKYKTMKAQIELKKAEHSHELLMVKAETEAMIMESKANIAINRAKVEGAIDLTDAQAFVQSQKEGNKSMFSNKWIDKLFSVQGKWQIITLPLAMLIATMFGFTDFLRGILRPALTVYLCGVTTWVTMMSWQLMQAQGTSLSTYQAVAIFDNVTSIVTYLTVSAVCWWFGDRRIGKTIMELHGADRTKIDDDIKI
jgi:hypothetical protein